MSSRNSNSNNKPRSRPVESSDPHNDLRVIWSADNKRIITDNRPEIERRERAINTPRYKVTIKKK